MYPSRNSVKGWLMGGAAALALALALQVGENPPPPVTVSAPPISRPFAPEAAAPRPISASVLARDVGSQSHRSKVDDFATTMHGALRSAEERNDEREMFAVGYRWVAADPEAALDFVLKLPVDHTGLLVALVDEWTRRDPASAARWAMRLPDGAHRLRVLPSMVAVWAESAPADALRFATGLPVDGVRNDAMISAASGWARQDPPAVLDWARQFLSGPQQEQVYTQAVFAWSQRDAVAVAEWLRAMPDSPAWDSATSVLSGALVDRRPALAFSLAANITDSRLRQERIENVARRWLAADRAEAEEALIRSDLPIEVVTRLLR